MIKIERHNYIIDKLQSEGSVIITDLSKSLDCHEETIRRDLRELEAEGKLIRIHGGAYLLDHSDKSVPTKLRSSFCIQEKIKMANSAINFIEPGNTIMLDSSTTCLQLAQIILEKNISVTILTNSLKICMLFDGSTKRNATLVCFGGQFRKRTSSFIGYKTTDSINSNYSSIAFISNPAIDMAFGLSDTNVNEAKVRNTMLAHSKCHIFLLDHTKFAKVSDNIFASPNVIDILITDKKLSHEWEIYLKKNNVQLIYSHTPS